MQDLFGFMDNPEVADVDSDWLRSWRRGGFTSLVFFLRSFGVWSVIDCRAGRCGKAQLLHFALEDDESALFVSPKWRN